MYNIIVWNAYDYKNCIGTFFFYALLIVNNKTNNFKLI